MLVGASQRVRVAVLLPLVAVYVGLAGSGASVLRAGVMGAAGLVAIAAGRRSSAVYSLLLAAVITLGLNPRATADPGWQLSFAAVAGMLLLGPLVQPRLRRLPRPLREAVGATTAATLATAPLMAHQFGTVSLVALPANVVAFPAVAPVMWIGMTEAAAEQLGALHPLAAVPHAVESLVAPVASLALRWVAGVATRFADPPWAQSQVQLGWTGAATIYVALAALALGVMRLARPGAPSRLGRLVARSGLGGSIDALRAMPKARRRALAVAPLALVLAAAADAAAPPSPPRHLTVDFIDVGQGDSTLIRDPAGAAVLFDGGVPEARVDRTLRHLGVRRLSVIVATHQSRDHHAGLLQVVRRFPVGLFLDGRYGVNDPTFADLERQVDSRHIPRRAVQRGQRLRVGAMTIQVLWPPPRGHLPPPANPNERAAVAIVSEGGFDLFLSADAESPVDLQLPLRHVDAMKVPHHGSADPGLPELLKRLRPRVAAIETGRGNSYGHPRPSTLDALRRRVPLVYRTDRDGTVELTVIGDRLAIRTHR
jgi:competence protein ComEC